jgi:23S rRNA G2445 N2-methylase RlmL
VPEPVTTSRGERNNARPIGDRVRDPGFTPSVRDVEALVDLLADDAFAKAAERAIGRVGAAALPVLRARLDRARAPSRARIARAVGRVAAQSGAEDAIAVLVAALGDADPKTRRNAAIALGHVRAGGVEDALIGAWEADIRPEMRRTLAASLGKVGTPRALAILEGASRAADAELARIAQRAAMMIARTASRMPGPAPRIDASRSASRPLAVMALSRTGLEDLLAEELARITGVKQVRVVGPGRVEARLYGPMQALFEARTMLEFHFPLEFERVRDGETQADAIARAASSDIARSVWSTWTLGPVRYRIAWAEGGHKRRATWDAVSVLARRSPDLVNDPTASIWELVVHAAEHGVQVAIAPRALDDPRFTWRREVVPAASHPTVAAALARVAGARPDDVVWDPFVGSGGELVERARLGPFRSLLGTDVDTRALLAARKNLLAAGVEATLERADSAVFRPEHVTLVITNPPMGRRAARGPGLADMLDRFVANAASALRPGGRLVWIAPSPGRSRLAATRSGLELERACTVDMGGFDAELQRWSKPG